jgi:hypothetical protein
MPGVKFNWRGELLGTGPQIIVPRVMGSVYERPLEGE